MGRMVKTHIGFALAAVLAAGCTPAHSRGVVAMKVSDSEVHVCVGKEEVSVGTQVDAYRNVCQQKKPYTCNLDRIDRGTITEVLNEHYSVAAFKPGSKVQEGDVIRVVP